MRIKMTNTSDKYHQDKRYTSQKMLDRATLLLNSAQAQVKREQELLNRKSTGPGNFQKRVKKVQAATQRVAKAMEAVTDFERHLREEELEAVKAAQEAAKATPVDVEIVGAEAGTEATPTV
jgi:1,6-anhydro-N-acetylmuramate kinase